MKIKLTKPKILFNPIDGSAPVSIYWYEGPKGDAVEAVEGNGVGFFDTAGQLLAVIFDDVSEKKDKQKLVFENGSIVTIVVSGKNIEIRECADHHKKKSA